MEELTLEREFLIRKMTHCHTILGAYYMKWYMQEQTKGAVNLPDFLVEPLAEEYSNLKVKSAMEDGSFLDKYEKAWGILAPVLP